MPKQFLDPASLAAVFRKEFEPCRVEKGKTVALLTELNTARGRPARAVGRLRLSRM